MNIELNVRLVSRDETEGVFIANYIGPVWFCSALVNSDTLTDYYGVKQSHFTKPTLEPRASDPEESNEAFDRVIRGWLLQYHCSKSSINYRH